MSSICTEPLTELFSEFPDHSRVWVFAIQGLSGEGATALESRVREFTKKWHAHQVPLVASAQTVLGSFLVVAVDSSKCDASGCSIDRLQREVTNASQAAGAQAVGHSVVQFESADKIEFVSRDEFEQLAAAGEVSPSTIVFDHTVQSLGDIRQGAWRKPASASWHARAFFG